VESIFRNESCKVEGEIMGNRTRRTYTAEFKQQAVRLAERTNLNRAAKELGVSRNSIQQWKKGKSKENPKVEKELSLEEELRRLRKENEELKQVNYILRRAAAVFSQDQLK
jgi:transposase